MTGGILEYVIWSEYFKAWEILECKHHVSNQFWIKKPYLLLGYSILTSIFPENREKYLGYGEASAGVGLMVGPVLGGFLYTYLGYRDCFFVFSGIIGITLGVCIYFLPKSLNRVDDPESNVDENGNETSKTS